MPEMSVLEALLRALRQRLSDSSQDQIGPLNARAIDSVLDVAHANKLMALVAGGLRPQLGAAQLSSVNRYKEVCLSRNSRILRDTLIVTRQLRLSGIAHVFIKGPTQQAALYGDFFVRPSLDIDVLVAGTDYQRAIGALAELDYSIASKSLWWRAFLGEQHLAKVDRMAPTIDLHYRLQQPGSPAPRGTECYVEEAVPCPYLDDHLPRLGDADIPVLSAISIVKALYHREPAGSHVADLFVSLKAGAPQVVNSFLMRAARQGITGSALLALRVVAETFEVGFEGVGLESVLPSVANRDLARMVFTPDDPDLVWPKRRVVLWELCRRRPIHFAMEAARAIASEATLRIVERPPAAATSG